MRRECDVGIIRAIGEELEVLQERCDEGDEAAGVILGCVAAAIFVAAVLLGGLEL